MIRFTLVESLHRSRLEIGAFSGDKEMQNGNRSDLRLLS